MATLTQDDLREIGFDIRARPTAKAQMKLLEPNKTLWIAAMQALEDGYNSRRVAIKAEMDAALGQTMTNALAKQLEDVWMEWRQSK